MHVHFADMIGCNNMLMLKVCKSLQKFLHTFANFWSIYFILFSFILHMREALAIGSCCIYALYYLITVPVAQIK